MAKLELEESESKYMEGSGVYLKNTLNVIQGTIYLTSKRIIFCKRSGLFNALAGPLLMHLSKGKHIAFEIKLDQIKSIHSEKHGFASKFIFTNRSGDQFAIQFMTGKEKWLKAICDAIKFHYPQLDVMQLGERYEITLKSSS
jgi:hypothetical protein